MYLTGSTTGTYAQYSVSEASDVHVLPDALDFNQGGACPPSYSMSHAASCVCSGRPHSVQDGVSGTASIARACRPDPVCAWRFRCAPAYQRARVASDVRRGCWHCRHSAGQRARTQGKL